MLSPNYLESSTWSRFIKDAIILHPQTFIQMLIQTHTYLHGDPHDTSRLRCVWNLQVYVSVCVKISICMSLCGHRIIQTPDPVQYVSYLGLRKRLVYYPHKTHLSATDEEIDNPPPWKMAFLPLSLSVPSITPPPFTAALSLPSLRPLRRSSAIFTRSRRPAGVVCATPWDFSFVSPFHSRLYLATYLQKR